MINPAFPELFSTGGGFIFVWNLFGIGIPPETNSEKILFSVFWETLLHVSESLRTSIELGDQRTHYTSFPLSASAQCYTKQLSSQQ